jgi:hypothetical protein
MIAFYNQAFLPSSQDDVKVTSVRSLHQTRWQSHHLVRRKFTGMQLNYTINEKGLLSVIVEYLKTFHNMLNGQS